LHLRCQEILHSWPKTNGWVSFLPDGRLSFLGPASSVWQVAGGTPQEAGKWGLVFPPNTAGGGSSADETRVVILEPRG
jgi:hypothetical protein